MADPKKVPSAEETIRKIRSAYHPEHPREVLAQRDAAIRDEATREAVEKACRAVWAGALGSQPHDQVRGVCESAIRAAFPEVSK